MVNSQHTIENQANSKGIRLDIYVRDRSDTVYAVEMQCENRALPKRSRFYQSSLDVDLLQKGLRYKDLNLSFIIFICTFDLFDQGRHFYSFQARCDQDPHLKLEDGTHKVFLNTKGTQDDVDEDIKEFLRYVESSTEQIAQNSKSELVRKVHQRVETIRNSEESEVEFMTFMQKLDDVWEDAKEAGLEEGRKEGLKEGLKKGQEQGRQEGLKEGLQLRQIQIAKKMIQAGKPVAEIMFITELSEAEIEEIKNSL